MPTARTVTGILCVLIPPFFPPVNYTELYNTVLETSERLNFLQLGELLTFHGSILCRDVHNHAITCLYKYIHFTGLIFVVQQSTMKIAKIRTLEIFCYNYGRTIILLNFSEEGKKG